METLILSLVGLSVPALFAAAYRHPDQYKKHICSTALLLTCASLFCIVAFGFAIDLVMEELRSPQLTPLFSTYAIEQLRFTIESYQPRKRWVVLHFVAFAYVIWLLFLPEMGLTWRAKEGHKQGA